MSEVTILRLYVLRTAYLILAVGLGATVWPRIISPPEIVANPTTVAPALLGALGALALVGIRYPLQMLPLLIFEILWKFIWLAAFGIPLWIHKGLDNYSQRMLIVCVMAVIIVPLFLPWEYLLRHYVKAPSTGWIAGDSKSPSISRL
jgi:hypothetical protein